MEKNGSREKLYFDVFGNEKKSIKNRNMCPVDEGKADTNYRSEGWWELEINYDPFLSLSTNNNQKKVHHG